MKYKIGDTVSVVRIKPSRPNDSPVWVDRMNKFLGKSIHITGISDKGYYLAGEWYFREEWLEDPISLNERICNKIKELDNKWKERHLKCA